MTKDALKLSGKRPTATQLLKHKAFKGVDEKFQVDFWVIPIISRMCSDSWMMRCKG